MRQVALGVVALSLLPALGCGGTAVNARSQMAEMERVRQAPAAREARQLAPQVIAAAEQERVRADQASREGDDVSAGLHAERAIAAYTRAFVLARLARATREGDEAAATLAGAAEDARQLATARTAIEREGDELDKQLRVARDAIAPASSAAADPQREAARLIAARALSTQARLLCGAARLVAGDASGLADAEKTLDELDTALDAPAKRGARPPIDAAARARAACLLQLTRARRERTPSAAAGAEGALDGRSDALLAELSAASGWDPVRDERGVVLTMRGLFRGGDIIADAESKLRELGRVAAAHPAFGVQLVVHDDAPPSLAERAADARRGEACARALVAGGAAASRVRVELAGARAPVVDPRDAAHRGRNARVEIVFVAPGG